MMPPRRRPLDSADQRGHDRRGARRARSGRPERARCAAAVVAVGRDDRPDRRRPYQIAYRSRRDSESTPPDRSVATAASSSAPDSPVIATTSAGSSVTTWVFAVPSLVAGPGLAARSALVGRARAPGRRRTGTADRRAGSSATAPVGARADQHRVVDRSARPETRCAGSRRWPWRSRPGPASWGPCCSRRYGASVSAADRDRRSRIGDHEDRAGRCARNVGAAACPSRRGRPSPRCCRRPPPSPPRSPVRPRRRRRDVSRSAMRGASGRNRPSRATHPTIVGVHSTMPNSPRPGRPARCCAAVSVGAVGGRVTPPNAISATPSEPHRTRDRCDAATAGEREHDVLAGRGERRHERAEQAGDDRDRDDADEPAAG